MSVADRLPWPRRKESPAEEPAVSRRSVLAGGAGLALAAAGCGSPETLTVAADGSVTVRVLAFQAPSLGAFLPAVIKARRIDLAHGVRIAFSYSTPDKYNTEFASGHYEIGASAALLSEALRTERGIDVTYLFNIFDYFSAVVTSNPDVQHLTDLRGRKLAAATGTTNHAMFAWFAEQAGLDLDEVEMQNQTPAGLSTMAIMGRTDGTEIWEPAYSSLRKRKPDIRSLDIGMPAWRAAFGTATIPYLGLAAHAGWARRHPDVVATLYRIYADAAAWTLAAPAAAAKIIAAATPRGKAATLQGLIEDRERLGLHVAPAARMTGAIDAVFEAGRQTDYLADTPPSTIVYRGL
ncbi:ABC transporter substrate-binding protein [Actinomadura sp. KC345]|uniref:ABC transporter substrate-binding protein n=1 Tax=Actinomadura sp. KC345 TaxID=2530371 RepID=UPI0014049DFA|nr:ABC transporter substrate-binding protein [Actinomadura sp. KC345]